MLPTRRARPARLPAFLPVTYTEACIILNMIPRIGPVRLRRLLEVFGEPQAILRAPAARLAGVEGIGTEIARGVAAWESEIDLAAELSRVKDAGVSVLTTQSELYPPALRTIYDPPIVLYVWGELTTRDARGISVVGSRRTTFYGVETARKLSSQLAGAGLTVFSGLARGIDTAAHEGALAAKGRTVAVLGCGLSQIYPPENYGLAERIADGSGAVISEFSMGIRPDRQTFPMRNRIISGCGLGLLVVEASLNSGALISAGQALEQGRPVFSVPGPIDRLSSQGTNSLIQQGAKLVMTCEDVLEELDSLPDLFPPVAPAAANSRPLPAPDVPPPVSPAPLPVRAAAVSLRPQEAAVLDAVEQDETPIDRIIAKCGLPTPVVSSTLLALELKKLIKQQPGKHYVRLG